MTSTTSETRPLRADDPGTPVVPASSGEALDGDMAYLLAPSPKDGCEDSKPTSSAGEMPLSDSVPSVGDAFVDRSQPPCAPWPVRSRRGPVRGKP
ncbi:DUF5949 family protein [Streptomyces sp. MMG1533]|uniref:DUF5949 family protein n=1 Tax=Streptomyces sp. MMG1533 TaxID=1415546 RepID=UPI000A4DDC08|nr:DUF5949 family protein [Streptomyces sp. MMG1533]